MAAEIRTARWRSGGAPPLHSRRRLAPPPRLTALPAAVTAASRGECFFIFGAGFVGRYVAHRLISEGWQVSGTCTSAIKKKELVGMGLDAITFEGKKHELANVPSLQHATHILISIPPIAGIGDPLLCYLGDLRSALNYGHLQWLCYLSSTSVYGDCGGAWVDEEDPVNPKTDSAKSRFAAEKGWLEIGQDFGVPVHVFRLGGIYGPGRSALDTIVKQKSLSRKQKIRESRLYTARVHVADIYQAIKASFGVPHSGVYNVVDDDPTPRAEVFAFAQYLIQRRWPSMAAELNRGDTEDLESQKVKIGGEKRVSNTRLKRELGVKLIYPSYRSGLQGILESWEHPPIHTGSFSPDCKL